MTTRKLLTAAVLLTGLSTLGTATLAQEARDPIVKFDSSTTFELDLAVIVEDILPHLLGVTAEEDAEEAQVLEEILRLVGIDALEFMKGRTQQNHDSAHSEFEITLDPAKSETLLYRLFTTPNGRCDFGRYVSRDDVVMFLTIHNFPHYLDVLFDFLAAPEMVEILGGEMPVNADGDLDFGGFVPRRDLLPLLAGELDAFVLTAPAGAPLTPLSAPVFVVLGTNDGHALWDRIVNFASMMDGDGGLAEMFAAVPPDTVGDFALTVLPIGGAVAVSQDFLVLGLAPDLMGEMLASPRGDLKVPEGIEWLHINGPNYADFMMSMPESGETAWLMEIYGVMLKHVESEEILYRSRKDGLVGEVSVKGPVLSGLYQTAVSLLAKLPERMAMEKADDAKHAYRDAIGMMDHAMMAYAAEHDGTYPADPEDLHAQGFLDAWPFAGPTPAGEYGDWSYTYHTYPDADGAVAGYIFFLYGWCEDEGYDVYTAENVAATGPFRPDRDGMPDGVVSFCYDGTAVEVVTQYLDKGSD